MYAKRWIGILTVVSLLALPGVAVVEGPLYVFTDLGTLGGMESMALRMNDQGTVVGWADVAAPTFAQTH